MIYPIKTLSQLPSLLKGFRKGKGLTQAAIAERLGITQQSYAYFEANPAVATVERLYTVLRLLDVEISLDQTAPATGTDATLSARVPGKHTIAVKAASKTINAPTTAKTKPKASGVAKPRRVATPTRTKERW